MPLNREGVNAFLQRTPSGQGCTPPSKWRDLVHTMRDNVHCLDVQVRIMGLMAALYVDQKYADEGRADQSDDPERADGMDQTIRQRCLSIFECRRRGGGCAVVDSVRENSSTLNDHDTLLLQHAATRAMDALNLDSVFTGNVSLFGFDFNDALGVMQQDASESEIPRVLAMMTMIAGQCGLVHPQEHGGVLDADSHMHDDSIAIQDSRLALMSTGIIFVTSIPQIDVFFEHYGMRVLEYCVRICTNTPSGGAQMRHSIKSLHMFASYLTDQDANMKVRADILGKMIDRVRKTGVCSVKCLNEVVDSELDMLTDFGIMTLDEQYLLANDFPVDIPGVASPSRPVQDIIHDAFADMDMCRNRFVCDTLTETMRNDLFAFNKSVVCECMFKLRNAHKNMQRLVTRNATNPYLAHVTHSKSDNDGGVDGVSLTLQCALDVARRSFRDSEPVSDSDNDLESVSDLDDRNIATICCQMIGTEAIRNKTRWSFVSGPALNERSRAARAAVVEDWLVLLLVQIQPCICVTRFISANGAVSANCDMINCSTLVACDFYTLARASSNLESIVQTLANDIRVNVPDEMQSVGSITSVKSSIARRAAIMKTLHAVHNLTNIDQTRFEELAMTSIVAGMHATAYQMGMAHMQQCVEYQSSMADMQEGGQYQSSMADMPVVGAGLTREHVNVMMQNTNEHIHQMLTNENNVFADALHLIRGVCGVSPYLKGLVVSKLDDMNPIGKTGPENYREVYNINSKMHESIMSYLNSEM